MMGLEQQKLQLKENKCIHELNENNYKMKIRWTWSLKEC